ncbi:MAG: HAMP domain-containing histidine kinase [Clostridia bacterium]|nr:HAMP domain-containing histidine kinase [Clostridia bacterium]
MKKSFRLKVIFSFTVSILFCIALLITSCRFMLRPIFIYDTKNSLENYSQLIADAYEGGSVTVRSLIDKLDSSHDIQSALVTGDMSIIVNSGEEIFPASYKVEQLRQWIDIYEKNKNKDGIYCNEIIDSTDNLARVVYIELIAENTYICMSKVVRGIDQEVRIATYFISGIGILIILMGAIIWSVLTRPFTKQMEKMSQVTKKMSQLEFDEKINYESNDEIGLLAKSIDEMSDELKKSIDKLQKDVERRKRLIRDISHELKTPVTTIRGYTENIQILSSDNARINRYCDIMIEECEVMDSLVSEMLHMSKLEDEGYECRMEIIDTKELEDKFKARLRNEFGDKNISVDFDKAIICANETLTERAVFNYVSNAVKYRIPDTPIEVKGSSDEKFYSFAVSNHGNEISAQDRELMWDVFYKTDKSRNRETKGHGIGLTMVKQIASLHGGQVAIESENGINTFIIRFPNQQNKA